MKKAILILIMSGFAFTGSAQDRLTGKSFATRSEVIAINGVACTSQPLFILIAVDILKKGGNAIAAAIAANAVLGLMEPTGNGIGGDLFAIVWDADTKQLHGLNGSGRSPKSLTLDYFVENGYEKIPAYGPLPGFRCILRSVREQKGRTGCRVLADSQSATWSTPYGDGFSYFRITASNET